MDALSALTNSGSSTSNTAGRGVSQLSSEDFTKLIITELTKQDPMQPNDTNALLNQIATIRSIESDTTLNSSLTNLVRQNDFASASTLIGKTVSGVSEENARVSGQVESISRTSSGTTVKLVGGTQIEWKNVDRVLATTP